ncbi:39S ribosomal protein L39, mitochondrial [Neodiprion virginianus]|uniref:39S ribosomal protein L39, mitochondrial n=1 Tax=Neodiprion virginianus TaxID=2961670 RepID=UPI001EE699F6|nr:39S ribosomal protein L39, mitochondrial [Neodiprion virginianus]
MINWTSLRLQVPMLRRCLSTLTKSEARKKRNELFDSEAKRQRAAVGRIEKIEVKYSGPSDEITLVMNKHLSTPFDCAKHISEGVTKVAALAEVNGTPWDMHRPFNSECEIKFVTMASPESQVVNKAFWRSCSLMMGAVAENAFKDSISIHLHSFPIPNVRSGSFLHDISLGFEDWKPTVAELQSLSALYIKLSQKNLPIERLVVGESIALEMFQDNPYKSEQIPNIARHSEDSVTLYRIGDHIDVSKGPMIGNTGIIGRCTVASVHKLSTDEYGTLYRFQGVALPAGILLNHFAYGILEERARKLNNSVWVPSKIVEDSEDQIAAVAN